MSKDQSVGILAGLFFVALFLAMLASFHGVARYMHAPTLQSYELAGDSKPAK